MVSWLGVILNPSKSEHIPAGDTSDLATYSFTSHTSPNAQPIQTVSSVHDLRLLLNAGFNDNDDVARATKKTWYVFFKPKGILRGPDPWYIPPVV